MAIGQRSSPMLVRVISRTVRCTCGPAEADGTQPAAPSWFTTAQPWRRQFLGGASAVFVRPAGPANASALVCRQPMTHDCSCAGSRPPSPASAAVRPQDRRAGPAATRLLTWISEGARAYCPVPASLAISASATVISKPRALRILPPAATTLGVPTTGATPIMTAWMSSAVTPLSAAAPALAR
jgi:hypothetical protein